MEFEETDVNMITSYLAGSCKLSNVQMYLADVNGDGIVNIRDAAALGRLLN